MILFFTYHLHSIIQAAKVKNKLVSITYLKNSFILKQPPFSQIQMTSIIIRPSTLTLKLLLYSGGLTQNHGLSLDLPPDNPGRTAYSLILEDYFISRLAESEALRKV